ncbi:SNF2 family N-terminal domain-containing protein, partial [Vararia minispora EC-137]
DDEERFRRLSYLLEKSELYAKLLVDQIEKSRQARIASNGAASIKQTKSGRKRGKGGARAGAKRARADSIDEEPQAKRVKSDATAFEQPALLTGATLKDYQLEGVQWMVGLWENGVSGILADEMGLGKTIQTIAFIAYLRARIEAPFLVVCPLSVLHNWASEFEKFAPDVPVCIYHGPPEIRAKLREKTIPIPTSKTKDEPTLSNAPDFSTQLSTFPVVLTTFEIVIRDRMHLSKYEWGFVVVDEGHRLKNMDSTLMREIKKYHSATRLVLTGTPLQNNLAELWSLLNFILPDIFNDISAFQDWFNLPTLSQSISNEKSTHILNTLHSILKPFLLRRLKSDVERSLPPKKEYVLYAPLTQQQREMYDAIVGGGIRSLLAGGKQEPEELQADTTDDKTSRKLRRRRVDVEYNLDDSDEVYFKKLARGEIKNYRDRRDDSHGKTLEQLGKEHAQKTRMKKINNLHLQNAVMQLRKVCSHPYLFDWPIDEQTNQPIIDEELVNASGKMMVLERLLDELFARGHKVLVFSQFVTMLDVIEDWATEFKGWSLCRIDGSTPALDRRKEMDRFQNGGSVPDAPRLFLLSTRSGGLGINLTAADTVVFYDQDWNPQMDLQAQDRAHRIGQTRPVLVFRLLTKHTIESKIMQRAGQKRQLEALVIAKGRKFKMPLAANTKRESMAEMARGLLELESERIEVVPGTKAGRKDVLSDEALDALLDRSPEVFERRGAGWKEADLRRESTGERKARKVREGTEEVGAFEVYDAPVDEGNDTLGRMFGEEDEE